MRRWTKIKSKLFNTHKHTNKQRERDRVREAQEYVLRRIFSSVLFCSVIFSLHSSCMFYSQWTDYHHVLNVWYEPDDDDVMLSMYTNLMYARTTIHQRYCFKKQSAFYGSNIRELFCVPVYLCQKIAINRRHNNNKKWTNDEIKSIVSYRTSLSRVLTIDTLIVSANQQWYGWIFECEKETDHWHFAWPLSDKYSSLFREIQLPIKSQMAHQTRRRHTKRTTAFKECVWSSSS